MRGKYLHKLVLIFALTIGAVSFSPTANAYAGDSDNIPISTENSSPNGGDNNGDGSLDGYQSTVATTTNPNDIESPDAWVSLEVTSPEKGSNWQIDEFNPIDPATLPSQPDGTVFPVGMFDVKLSCSRSCNQEEVERSSIESTDAVLVGNTVRLKLIFDRVMDTSNWTTFKYNPSSDTYVDYGEYVTISTQNIAGTDRTVVEWDVVDGGIGDADGLVNCQISDPIGPGVPVDATTSLTLPTSKVTTNSEPKLANTGIGANIVLGIAVILIALSVAIFPKKSLR